MAYQALYRKYRPSTLEDVIGQDVVIKILKNSVINNKVAHAYLFSGPRGIGKTTIAKAFAKVINCLNPKDGNSCEKCDNCKQINSGFCPDIIEIDAASNNGVDEIREIKSKINLVPNELKYKVYIVDEVHMLSIGAFNALLKTLEEPPEHIIFILATTDLQKVPATIISRCQCFDFHRITNENIVKRLECICKNENIKVSDDVLNRIAELADGGLRDAVGMLDKINAYSNSNVTLEDFEKINGIVSKKDIIKFFDYIFENDIKNMFSFIDNIYDNGKDLIIFTSDLLNVCKNECISYYIENNRKYDAEKLLVLADSLNSLLTQIKTTSDVKTSLEINLLLFINKYIETENSASVEKVSIDKNTEEVKETNQQVIVEKEKVELKESIEIEQQDDYSKYTDQIINNCFARADKKEKQMFEEKWKTIGDYALDSKYGAVASFLTDGTIRAVGTGEIIISFNYDSMVTRGLNLIEKVQKLLKKVYNKDYDIAFITEDKWNDVKNEFIENKNKGKKYEYVPLEKVSIDKETKLDDDSITSKAQELFGDNVISVN